MYTFIDPSLDERDVEMPGIHTSQARLSLNRIHACGEDVRDRRTEAGDPNTGTVVGIVTPYQLNRLTCGVVGRASDRFRNIQLQVGRDVHSSSCGMI